MVLPVLRCDIGKWCNLGNVKIEAKEFLFHPHEIRRNQTRIKIPLTL